MLHAITCLFNPCGYASRDRNYWTFRERLGCPLTTIELSFTGSFSVPDAIQLTGSTDNIMWQKERLLNLAIESLPAEVDKVAWVDADLVFRNEDWAEETERLLEEHAVVQLFDTICNLDANGRPISGYRGLAYGVGGVPGGALAARREALSGGLFDEAILGGGDRLLALACQGNWSSGLFSHYPKPFVKSFWRWASQQHALAGRGIGSLSGTVLHLNHGSRADRQHDRRLQLLREFDFDPSRDLARDDNGIWRWASDKARFHRLVRDYFRGRNEDKP